MGMDLHIPLWLNVSALGNVSNCVDFSKSQVLCLFLYISIFAVLLTSTLLLTLMLNLHSPCSLGLLASSTSSSSAAFYSQLGMAIQHHCVLHQRHYYHHSPSVYNISLWGERKGVLLGDISCSVPEGATPCTESITMPQTQWMVSLHGL